MKQWTTVLFIVASLGWSCCRAGDNVKEYVLPQAAGAPLEDIARVVATPGPKGGITYFGALYDANNREIKVRKWPVVHVTGKRLLLTPGRYSISVTCDGNEVPPKVGTLPLDVAAGRTYSIWCEPVPWGFPKIRFREDSHADWDARPRVSN